MGSAIAARDGTLDFSGGVNSLAVTTLASQLAVGGLKRNESSWLINYTARDGGLTQRGGWIRVGQVATAEGLFQGKTVYNPVGEFPYEIWMVSGHVLKVTLDDFTVTDLSEQFGLFNPATEPYSYFVQAEEFLVIQAGDNVTLPLFWDGATLRRSNGITDITGGQPTAVYDLTPVSPWVVPTVGNTRSITMTATIPAGLVIGNTGTYQIVGAAAIVGTFEVTNVVGSVLTIETIASAVQGATVPASPAQFTVDPAPTPTNVNELPAATAMCYYMDRIWYAQGRVVTAGDLVFGPSGTAAYGFRDSVLKVTENPLALGGDGFIVPSQDGDIRALQYGANIDAALGQGRLFIFTRKAVYALQVPVSRQDWIDAGANNQPLMTVVQLANGSVNDRSVVPVNGDLFYQSLEPGIRSLMQSIRYFTQWANTELSANENRILQFNDRSLMRAASGIFFNNRLLQTTLPRETDQGIVSDQIIPLDVLPVSTFEQQRRPNWEGSYQAMPVFQLKVADFGGRERAFAAVRSEAGDIELWELTEFNRMDYASETDADAHRMVSQVETPAFTWGDSIGELELKQIMGAELWVDRLWGTVEFTLEYRPDGSTCWLPWLQWKECTPRTTAETFGLPASYPVAQPECYKQTMILPRPPETCQPCGTGRPSTQVYQCQARITVKGFHRLRGFWIWAQKIERPLMPATNVVC